MCHAPTSGAGETSSWSLILKACPAVGVGSPRCAAAIGQLRQVLLIGLDQFAQAQFTTLMMVAASAAHQKLEIGELGDDRVPRVQHQDVDQE